VIGSPPIVFTPNFLINATEAAATAIADAIISYILGD